MLVLADRRFLSWALAREFLATGARILWRASAAFALKPVEVLADGTYLAELTPPRKSDGPPLTVRVIKYTVRTAPHDGSTEESSEVFCLVTDLLDAGEYPALDLANRPWRMGELQLQLPIPLRLSEYPNRGFSGKGGRGGDAGRSYGW